MKTINHLLTEELYKMEFNQTRITPPNEMNPPTSPLPAGTQEASLWGVTCFPHAMSNLPHLTPHLLNHFFPPSAWTGFAELSRLVGFIVFVQFALCNNEGLLYCLPAGFSRWGHGKKESWRSESQLHQRCYMYCGVLQLNGAIVCLCLITSCYMYELWAFNFPSQTVQFVYKPEMMKSEKSQNKEEGVEVCFFFIFFF